MSLTLWNVQWNSPFNNEPRSQDMTEAQAAQWWEMASQPVRETARFGEAPTTSSEQA